MDTTVLIGEHEITLRRSFTEMVLLVDGKKMESVEGVFKKDHDAVLSGHFIGDEGEEVEIKVEYKSGGIEHLFGSATFYSNGKKIAVKTVT